MRLSPKLRLWHPVFVVDFDIECEYRRHLRHHMHMLSTSQSPRNKPSLAFGHYYHWAITGRLALGCSPYLLWIPVLTASTNHTCWLCLLSVVHHLKNPKEYEWVHPNKVELVNEWSETSVISMLPRNHPTEMASFVETASSAFWEEKSHLPLCSWMLWPCE